VRMMPAVTGRSPDEGYTAGSMSVQYSGAALRLVCAEARGLYLAAAAVRLGVAQDKLTVADGEFGAPDGRATSYWELADDGLLDRPATGGYPPKPVSAYRLVGTSAPRLDLPDKMAGRPRYAHDLSPDGLCYGRVVRPPSRGATLAGLDTTAALALPGVLAVVRDGSFLGVVAEREEVALRAADRLRAGAVWDRCPALPGAGDLPAFLMSAAAETTVLAEAGEPPAPGLVTASHEATYHRPYLAHASMGPSTATALASSGASSGVAIDSAQGGNQAGNGDRGQADGQGGPRLRVWSHTQGVYQLRAELARALRLAPGDIVVTHVAGAGCYGHNGADDAAL
ncbi:MAG TPA: molybdopterin cofactor-binding domain-containing protein, partial [Streptosporangiaceae bacterium]|nr:molybdopterin cofactor-binding domain-containing protein [Streptosporangiaceae bacterium]